MNDEEVITELKELYEICDEKYKTALSKAIIAVAIKTINKDEKENENGCSV